jgi:pectin methylesterase-like acyl-CoA thioesterase
MTNRSIHPGAIAPLAAALFCLTTHAEFNLTNRYPADHAESICTDTPLRLTFNEPVALGSAGLVKIVRVGDGKIVDALEVADGGWTNLFGTKLLRYEPFRIDGNTITVQLRAHVLEGATNTTFAVVIEPGVFKSAGGEAFGGMTNGDWQFTTRAPLPKNRTRLEVAPDSRGDFCTLQGAVDYIPEDNYTPFEIYIRKGTYDAVAHLGPGRNRIRVVGEDRKESILAGRNNDRLNPGRMMRPFVSVDADDVTFENLTIRNTTPYRGSQAEALRLSGQRCTMRDCDFYSFQDTLLLNGRVYVANCYVEGDVDFIWGHGVTFFENCELKAMHDGYYVTSRNPEDQFGFVFSRCRLTAAPDVKRNWLARIGTDRFPGSAVAFLNCQMGPHIPAAGWQIRGEDRAHLRFYEFNSTTLDGQPLDVSQRDPASRQLSRAEAAALSDPNQVLACQDHWKPKP